MAFAYILKSQSDGKHYIGSTINLKNRLHQHNLGEVKSTKNRRPLTLVGFRELETIEEAASFERKYKNSHGQLERDIKNGKITKVN